MPPPSNTTELKRFLGMANQLSKFTSKLAELSQPLRELLSSKNAWVWGASQESAFTSIKEELSKPTVLALHNPSLETKVSADASSFGLGAVSPSKTPDWMEAHSVCIKITYRHGTPICTNWEGRTGCDVGLRTLCRVHTWTESQDWNRPQATGPNIWIQALGLTSSKNVALSAENGQV